VNADGADSKESVGAPATPPPRRTGRGRRILYLWLSIELAAGIIALSEVVFALPPVILLEAGRTALSTLVPSTILGGATAVYLGRAAFPLVGEVARLGRVP
jgi:hypothetical protein